jgi:hypothetical protein
VSPSSIRLACGGERDAVLIRDREWLVTNGLGGYASGTVLGVPTRRYHGLFIPNLPHPEGRHLMIGRYDEELIAGDVRALLGGADLEDGTTESDAGAYLREFVLDGLTPTWRFEVGGARREADRDAARAQRRVCFYRLSLAPPFAPHPALRRLPPGGRAARPAPAPFRPTIEGGGERARAAESPLALRFRAARRCVRGARAHAGARYREERDCIRARRLNSAWATTGRLAAGPPGDVHRDHRRLASLEVDGEEAPPPSGSAPRRCSRLRRRRARAFRRSSRSPPTSSSAARQRLRRRPRRFG